MAIYKNREVSVNSLTQPHTEEPMVSISWDGNTEQVRLSQLRFTKDEVDGLKKSYPGPQGSTGSTGASGLAANNYQQSILTYTGSDVTWVYAVPYSTGVVPVIEAVASSGSGSSTAMYNVQIVGNPTNTQVTFRVNTIPAASVLLVGLLNLTLFQQAPSGVKLHVTARNP